MSLEADFQTEMLAIYRRAYMQFGYPAKRFLRMVRERGGVEAARRLLATGPSDTSSGLDELIRRGGVDGLALSVESLVLKQRFRSLFTEAELNVARARLQRLLGEIVA